MSYQQLCNPIRYNEGVTVTFGDDSKDKIIGRFNIKIGSSPLIEDIILVEGPKHNRLSMSQMCDKGLMSYF